MFCVQSNAWRKNTALVLTLRFAVLFLLCAAALMVTADRLLTQAEADRDRQLINSLLQSYQRLEAQAGLHKLELVVERDSSFLRRSRMRLWLTQDRDSDRPIAAEVPETGNTDNTDQAEKAYRLTTPLLIQPEGWVSPQTLPPHASSLSHSDDRGWGFERVDVGNGEHLSLMVRSIALGQGLHLQIGRSTEEQQARLAEYRILVLKVMVPLVLLGLILTAYMNWRALRPVHDLIETVRQIGTTDLSARVEIRNPASELGELARLFNAMLSRIEKLIVNMQCSLDSVAHDLRTPMARMRLSVESALVNDSPAALREALLDCAEESERMERMLRMLLEVTEAESGTLSLHRETVAVAPVLAQAIDLYGFLAQEKGIHLQYQCRGVVDWQGDPVRLMQIIGNLLDNAIKYTSSGGMVRVTCDNCAEQLVLEVGDNGIGIAAADQAHLFERLFRADAARREPGMGLGLNLVKAVVGAFNGTITVQSEPGKGSLFRVELPVYSP